MRGVFLYTGENKKAFDNAQLLLFSLGFTWYSGDTTILNYSDTEGLAFYYDEYKFGNCTEEYSSEYEIIDVTWLSEVDI